MSGRAEKMSVWIYKEASTPNLAKSRIWAVHRPFPECTTIPYSSLWLPKSTQIAGQVLALRLCTYLHTQQWHQFTWELVSSWPQIIVSCKEFSLTINSWHLVEVFTESVQKQVWTCYESLIQIDSRFLRCTLHHITLHCGSLTAPYVLYLVLLCEQWGLQDAPL